MFHEENAQIVIRKGVSDAQLDEFRERNKDVKAEVEKAKEKASWKIEEEAYKRLQGKDPQHILEVEIMETIIQCAFDCGKYVPNPFLARAMM